MRITFSGLALAARRLGILAALGAALTFASPTPAAPVKTDRFDQLVAAAKDAMLSNPRQAEGLGKQAEAIAMDRRSGEDRNIALATAEWLQAEALVRQNDTNKAAPLIEHALANLSAVDRPTKVLADILVSRGWIESAKPDVAAALRDYQRAFEIYRRLNEVRSQAISLLSIASLYHEALDYGSAMRYYTQALELSSVDPKLAVSIYNNRGNTLKDSGKPELAIREYQQALKILTQLQAPAIEAQVNHNIALTAIDQNNLPLAKDAARRGMAAAKLDDDAGTLAQFNALNAYLLLSAGQTSEARQLIDKVFAGVDLAKTPLAARIDHEFAFKIYQRLGDSEKALAHLTALKRLDDQATQLAISTGTALMSARFDYANQNLNIARLKRAEAQRSLELERSRAHFQRILFFGSAIAALIVFGMLGFGIVTLRRSRNEVRAANIELAASNSALEKALAAKTEFLATTSHEIRTPLNGILGMTQVMLSDTRISAETRDRISIVHGAGVTMRALVDDILDVAKMETGNMTIENAPFDLAALVTDLARMWRDQATTKGLAFEMHTDACPKMIMGDAARLRQIVFNLLSNALKFTAEGKVGLEVTAVDGRLRIAISDTGIGIPADKQGIIFESFRQGDAGTTRQFGGTGLGLSICRNLARAMGGDVVVASEPGKGSTFTIDLPLVLAEQPATAAVPGEGEPALLVIDRNPITRSMLKALLAPRAGTVLATGSTADALPMLADNPVARVLVDAGALDAGEGDDAATNLSTLAEAVRARGATLVLMAPGDHPILQSAATITMEAVVSKPITGAALVELLYPVETSETAMPQTGLVSQAA